MCYHGKCMIVHAFTIVNYLSQNYILNNSFFSVIYFVNNYFSNNVLFINLWRYQGRFLLEFLVNSLTNVSGSLFSIIYFLITKVFVLIPTLLISADFGFARFLNEGMMAGTLCGSPMYMVSLSSSRASDMK